MAVKICMIPFNGQTALGANGKVNREEVVVGSSTHNLEIANDGDTISVRVPFGYGDSSQGKILFSALACNVFYAIHV